MPKSGGRRKGAKNRPVRRSPRPLQPADLLLGEARDIIDLDDVLTVETCFALTQRGLDPEWIAPVLDAVDTYLPVFHDAFDDETAWGPAKQVAAALTERGIDLTDRHAVDNAIHHLNAEQLAHDYCHKPHAPERTRSTDLRSW